MNILPDGKIREEEDFDALFVTGINKDIVGFVKQPFAKLIIADEYQGTEKPSNFDTFNFEQRCDFKERTNWTNVTNEMFLELINPRKTPLPVVNLMIYYRDLYNMNSLLANLTHTTYNLLNNYNNVLLNNGLLVFIVGEKFLKYNLPIMGAICCNSQQQTKYDHMLPIITIRRSNAGGTKSKQPYSTVNTDYLIIGCKGKNHTYNDQPVKSHGDKALSTETHIPLSDDYIKKNGKIIGGRCFITLAGKSKSTGKVRNILLEKHYGHKRDNIWIDIPYPTAGFIGKKDRYGPYQKPIEIYKRLIVPYTNPKDIVYFPHDRYGTGALVTLMTGRRCVSGDVNSERYFDIKKRLDIYNLKKNKHIIFK